MRSSSRWPAGHSIGRALEFPAGPHYDDVRATIAAIDRVHGVGDLPSIRIQLINDANKRARLRFDPITGDPVSIVLRASDPHLSFVAIHELGHFLDLTAAGDGPDFGSTVNPVFAEWNRAAVASRAYRLLSEIARQGVARLYQVAGVGQVISLNVREVDAVRALLLPEELWARSYAQFVASRSGDPGILRSLDSLRTRVEGTVYYPRQWGDDDFGPIDAAVDDLMAELGWRR